MPSLRVDVASAGGGANCRPCRRCLLPRWKPRSYALALCRRWLCRPRRRSPLFVVDVERSSIIAASTLASASL
ncbi:hypothetical protein Syun_014110 [Stephania yunnanensis]|uniref:Uncharacterized protein n=1 Tax=Stephania yunnanensis TaxID=152371 RepID=A0AAP0JJH4_9MAGN